MHCGVTSAGFALLIGLTGCASLPPACLSPQQTMATAEILFGRKIGDRVGVSEAAFAQFTAGEITPRFPDGLTVIDANGQWRVGSGGRIVREPSKVVLIVFRDEPGKRDDIQAIARAYKARFSQQSVLTSVRTSCVSF